MGDYIKAEFLKLVHPISFFLVAWIILCLQVGGPIFYVNYSPLPPPKVQCSVP